MIPTQKHANGGYSLDLFSTSQKRREKQEGKAPVFCAYNAPFFAYQIHLSRYGVSQGCCNHWDCPRCGQVRAKTEYGRIVAGIRELATTTRIFFITITCKGKEMSYEEAEAGYLTWTNRLFSAWRARTKSKGGQWCYVQVTERQTRGHPHSHILTTANIGDLYLGHVWKERKQNDGSTRTEREIALRSDWFMSAVERAGLGSQYDISIASSPEGASRYVAKYLFKPSIFENTWPKGWKRVRYSQNFPRLPERETDAFVLLSDEDWRWLGRRASIVEVQDSETLLDVRWRLRNADTLVSLK